MISRHALRTSAAAAAYVHCEKQRASKCDARGATGDVLGPSGRNACATTGNTPYRVLVVGAGLGGSLCARELRRLFGGDAAIHVWERATRCRRMCCPSRLVEEASTCCLSTLVKENHAGATYGAGRFASRAEHGDVRADLGSQVLSTVNPDDARALPGHGISSDAVRAAWAEVRALEARGLLSEVPDDALAATEERMGWPGLWRHHVAPCGLSVVVAALLGEARPDAVEFRRRVEAVEVSADGVLVRAAQRGEDAEHCLKLEPLFPGKRMPCLAHASTPVSVSASFDAVVVAIPAPDALAVVGAAEALPDDLIALVRYVRSAILGQRFGDRLELDEAEGLEFVAYRPRDGPLAVLVAHSVATSELAPDLDADAVLAALAVEQLRGRVVETKSIGWNTAQMVTPLEALAPRSPVAGEPCIHNAADTLVLAGDYCTQSSFLGTYASARAAARAVHRGAQRRRP